MEFDKIAHALSELDAEQYRLVVDKAKRLRIKDATQEEIKNLQEQWRDLEKPISIEVSLRADARLMVSFDGTDPEVTFSDLDFTVGSTSEKEISAFKSAFKNFLEENLLECDDGYPAAEAFNRKYNAHSAIEREIDRLADEYDIDSSTVMDIAGFE